MPALPRPVRPAPRSGMSSNGRGPFGGGGGDVIFAAEAEAAAEAAEATAAAAAAEAKFNAELNAEFNAGFNPDNRVSKP